MANTTGKKFGGRKRGSRNKITPGLKDDIKSFLTTQWPLLKRNFKKLKPEQQYGYFEKLLPYVVPKMASVTELESLTEEQINQIIEKLKEQVHK